MIVLFGVCAPWLAHYKVSDSDGVYAKVRPYSAFFDKLGIGFWDGSRR